MSVVYLTASVHSQSQLRPLLNIGMEARFSLSDKNIRQSLLVHIQRDIFNTILKGMSQDMIASFV